MGVAYIGSKRCPKCGRCSWYAPDAYTSGPPMMVKGSKESDEEREAWAEYAKKVEAADLECVTCRVDASDLIMGPQ